MTSDKQENFLIHHAIAKMVGVDKFSLKLNVMPVKHILSGYVMYDIEIIDLNNNPITYEAVSYYLDILQAAINNGELKPVNFDGELSKINYYHALFSESDIAALFIKHGYNDRYFNPEITDQPESIIPSADDSKDIAIIETDCSKRTRTRKATEIHSENANKRLADTINELKKKTPEAINKAKKLRKLLNKHELLKIAEPVLIKHGYKANHKCKPFILWRDSLPDGVADRQNRAQKNRR